MSFLIVACLLLIGVFVAFKCNKTIVAEACLALSAIAFLLAAFKDHVCAWFS